MKDMKNTISDLVELLDLENLEINLFRGQSRNLGGKSVYGGQVVAQSLVAAYRTLKQGTNERIAHSLHAYFLRPGDMEAPIVYDVERIRDGLGFSVRRIKAIQHGKTIFTMMASFQVPEVGYQHQMPMPDVPPPEDVIDQSVLRKQWVDELGDSISDRLRQHYLRELPVEFRPIQPQNPFNPEKREPVRQIWFRSHGGLPDDALVQQCALVYATDFNLLGTAFLPHGTSYMQPGMMVTSLDHAVWIYRPARVDEWLLYCMDSPGAIDARGYSRGLVYNRQGELVACVAQESLMRNTNLSAPTPTTLEGFS